MRVRAISSAVIIPCDLCLLAEGSPPSHRILVCIFVFCALVRHSRPMAATLLPKCSGPGCYLIPHAPARRHRWRHRGMHDVPAWLPCDALRAHFLYAGSVVVAAVAAA